MNRQLFFIAMIGLSLLSACRQHEHDEALPAEAEHADADRHDHADILFPADRAKAVGIQTDTIKAGAFHGIIKTGGKILSASGDETVLTATVAGVVSLARPVTEGMAVSKGSTLFVLSSSALPEGDIVQRTYITYQTAKADYERARALVAEKIVSDKDFQAAEAAYERAKLAYDAVGKGNTTKGVSVRTTVGGFVKECMVKAGDYVEIGQPLMIVSQNKHLYLRAEVAERDYASLSQVVSAKFKTAYSDKVYDLAELAGHLVSYGKTSEGASPFIPVTFAFDNATGIIPGSFAEVWLLTTTRNHVVSVPVSALTEEQGAYFVYVQEDEDSYRKQAVSLGATDGQRTEITAGLREGDCIVTAGAVHIKLAAAGSNIPGHTHNH